jgi:hypothetical protein
MIHENLIFVVCSPRSGSTLIQRMLASHSAIFTHPEPHLITPLAFLGFYHTVDKAPYDHINAAEAFREFAQELPRGEEDYLDAVRAYASTLYERVLAPTGKRLFLDKTPAYALVLPFLVKLFPRAKYVVLTRHPMAVFHSQAHSFFGGDYRVANDTNPVVGPYVAAIGKFLREKPVPAVRVRYEDLVKDPEPEMRRILDHLGLSFEPGVVEYGKQKHISKSFGDPMSVERHSRPVTDSLETWAQDLLARPTARRAAQEITSELASEDLEAWGYPKDQLFAALDRAGAKPTRAKGGTGYRFKRWVLLRLRKNIHHNLLGKLLRKIRYYCDVLLRE